MSGAAGFSRTVAIKRLHANFAKNSEFVAMFLDEARLVARIRHPNVVPTLDVVATDGEIFLVMEYVPGESLAKLRRATFATQANTDPRIVAGIMSGVLHGLHAAHEAKDERGQLLNIVHRDVSPQNLLVGVDGVARVLDFGVAKAMGGAQTASDGQIKGKLAYMAPDQLLGRPLTRQADVYGAAVVTWETLTGQRLFRGENQGAIITAVLQQPILPPSKMVPGISVALDAVVTRGLERDPARRYASARDMALDLERCAGIASPSDVGAWVESLAHDELSKRAARLAEVEGSSAMDSSAPSPMPAVTERPYWNASSSSPSSHSDPSAVAMAQAIPTATHSRARIAVAGGAAGVAFLAAAMVVLVAGRHGPTPVAAAAAPPLAPSSASSPPASEPAPPVTVTATAGTDPPSGTGTEQSPRAAPPSLRPSKKPLKRDCDTPFTIDELGHKHYKAACL
jgi:serine/threonine-protein kinase